MNEEEVFGFPPEIDKIILRKCYQLAVDQLGTHETVPSDLELIEWRCGIIQRRTEMFYKGAKTAFLGYYLNGVQVEKLLAAIAFFQHRYAGEWEFEALGYDSSNHFFFAISSYLEISCPPAKLDEYMKTDLMQDLIRFVRDLHH